MSMAPFSAPPVSPQSEARRARLALLIATLGIAATLLAYAVSPGVRHAVSHAAHSVKGAVSKVLDHDGDKRTPARRTAPAKASAPAQRAGRPARSLAGSPVTRDPEPR